MMNLTAVVMVTQLAVQRGSAWVTPLISTVLATTLSRSTHMLLVNNEWLTQKLTIKVEYTQY